MKKVTVLLSLILMVITIKIGEAQMPAAKKVVWDAEVKVNVKASKGDVWQILNDNKKLQYYSNGYVKSIKSLDQELVDSREVVFANGNKRSETITQTDHLHKFMVIVINKASLPKGVKYAQIAIFTKDIDGENTSISWYAMVNGKKLRKQQLVEQLKAEFNAYAKGFGSIQEI